MKKNRTFTKGVKIVYTVNYKTLKKKRTKQDTYYG